MKAKIWMRCAALALAATPPITAVAQTIRADHLAIRVADVDASAAFYSDLFGLKTLHTAATGPRWLDLGGGMALHLLPGRTVPVVDNRYNHLAFATPDLTPIIAKLKARHIEFSDFPGNVGAINTARNDGVHQIFFRDPDGYWIEINDALATH